MGAAPYSPRDQRRQARDYWRAQRQAARMQRSYWRGMRQSSVTGPVVLILIGIVALLLRTGRLQGEAFWPWYGRWWPLLLIGIGLISMAEWLVDRNSGYPVRRSMGGLVILVVALSMVGAASGFAHNFVDFGNRFTDNFGDNGDNFFSFMGVERDNDTDITKEIAANASVQVQNPRGDVTLTASSDSQLHVHTHKVVRTSSEGDADRLFRQLEPSVIVSGTSLLVKVDSGDGGRADLTIEVPKSAATDVTAGHGDVTVEGLDAASNVLSRHGDVKFDGMGGSITAHVGGNGLMNHNDFSAHAVGGDVTLDGALGDVTVSEVKGKVLLTGEYYGDAHLERVAKGVHFHSSRTDMEIASLAGDITMSSDDLHMSQASGPVQIKTSHKNIDATQIAGDIHIEDTNGDVNVLAALPLGNIQIRNRNQPVTLTLPTNASFTLAGTTTDGALETDFDLGVMGSENNHSVSGQVGKGGVKIELTNAHSDLHVRKGDAVAEIPGLPEAPERPEKPEKPEAPTPPGKVKHLHPPKDTTEQTVVQ